MKAGHNIEESVSTNIFWHDWPGELKGSVHPLGTRAVGWKVFNFCSHTLPKAESISTPYKQ